VAAEQDGAISIAQLRGAGLDRGAVQHRVRNGRLHPVHYGVYAWGHPKLGPRGLLWAAQLATDGVISHASAAWAWALLPPPALPVHVTVTRRLRSRRGIRVHQSTTLAPEDVTDRDGLRVTTVARTLADLPPRLQRRAAREAAFRELIDHAEVAALLTRHHGAARLERTLERVTGAPVRSALEHDFLDIIERLGLPRPEHNHVVAGRERDYYWPAHALVVEIDGGQHDRGVAPTIDRRRDRELLVATGIRTVRFDDTDSEPEVAQTLRPLLVP
jgi:hypothetical protein